jgi:hypothetical protein
VGRSRDGPVAGFIASTALRQLTSRATQPTTETALPLGKLLVGADREPVPHVDGHDDH